MANKISVIIDVAVDKANRGLTNFRKAVMDADGAVGKFKAGTKSAGDSVKANLAPMVISAGAALAVFATKAIKSASDLEESTNAVNVSFGEAADGVLAIGENAAESMGLSESAFNQAAVGFAAFAGTVAGKGGDVSEVIGEITQRSADFASVMNLDVTEAANIFRSALAGETEPIRKFGIDLSAAAVEAHALATGLVDSKSEMTEAIKVQARYSLLMEKTTKFAGDFANTSDGLANSTRIAAARIEDFQASVGQKLIPTVASAVNVAMDLADALEQVGIEGSTANKRMKDEGVFDGLRRSAEWVINPIGSLTDAINEGTAAVGELTGSTDEAAESTKNLGDAYVANYRGFKAWENSVKESEAAAVYKDHADGMVAESKRIAKENEKATERIERAWEDLADELSDRSLYLDIQDALSDVEQAYMTAADTAGKSLAEQEADARNVERSVLSLKGLVDEYAKDVSLLPPEVATELRTLIDEGSYAEVERRLASLERVRMARIAVSNAGPDSYVGGGNIKPGSKIHDGGVVGVGKFASDEVPAVLQKGEMVLTKGQQASVAAAMAGGGNVYNSITIYTTSPEETVNAIKKYSRRNGPGGLPQ